MSKASVARWLSAACVAAALISPRHAGAARAPSCRGDCNGDGVVSIDELLVGVNIVLGILPIEPCVAMDGDGNGEVSVDEVIGAVNAALLACSGASPTATALPSSTPTPGGTATPADGWESRRPLPGPMQEVGVAALNGRIYVVGGFDGQINIVPSVEVYDPTTDSWSSAAPLPEALHHVGVVAVADKLYAVGGLRGYTFTAVDSVYVYDPEFDRWSPRAGLARPRGAAAVGVVDGAIYAAGGLRDGDSVDDFAAYDPSADAWTDLPAMPTARDHHGAAVVNGIFYAVGGRAGRLYDVVEAFDPEAGSWSTRSPLPTARGGLAVAAMNGRIFAIGGEGNVANPRGVFPQVEVYDPARDEWSDLPPMRTARHGTGATSIDNRIYVPGGAIRANFGPSAVNEALIDPFPNTAVTHPVDVKSLR